jgi:hypothetical protein
VIEIVPWSHLVMGLGAIVVVAGVIQVFLQTIDVQRGRRGRIWSRFRLRSWSSIWPGMIMVVIGALLLGVGPLVDAL